MSQHVYVRDVMADGLFDLEDGVREIRISKRVETALPGLKFKVLCTGTECLVLFPEDDLSLEQISALDDTVAQAKLDIAASVLDRLKGFKLAEIAERTQELIVAGFSFGGKVMPMHTEARVNYGHIWQFRDKLVLMGAFPMNLVTLDDADVLTINDLLELEAFVDGALGSATAVLLSDVPLKQAVAAATTVEELNAVVDPR